MLEVDEEKRVNTYKLACLINAHYLLIQSKIFDPF